MPYSLSLFYSYPLSKAQLKSHLLIKPSLCDSPERHNQPLSEMPLFEVFSCLSLLRFELLEDLSYSSFQAPYTVSSSGLMK